MIKIRSSGITPEHTYLSRRRLTVGIGALAANSLLAACASQTPAPTPSPPAAPQSSPTPAPTKPTAGSSRNGLTDEPTSYDAVTNYNNYYEFTTAKEKVARLAEGFRTTPWTVEVGGLVHKPKTFDLDDLLKFGQEERIYRLRCVEAWSMVIPWQGFPLAKLLEEVEPTSQAKYVRFETLYDPSALSTMF